MNPTQEFKDEMIAGLRKMADWLENTPVEMPVPASLVGSVYTGAMHDSRGIRHMMDSTIGMALIANAAGDVDKEVNSQLFKLVKDFGGGVKVEWVAYREAVCERVVVGTKIVPAEPERVVAAVPERTEEVVEWKCPSLLKAAASVEMDTTPVLESPRQPLLNAPEAVDDLAF